MVYWLMVNHWARQDTNRNALNGYSSGPLGVADRRNGIGRDEWTRNSSREDISDGGPEMRMLGAVDYRVHAYVEQEESLT